MFVYILYSSSLKKHYVGQTKDLKNRLYRHNKGYEKFTKNGCPWILLWNKQVENRTDAVRLERKIKSRGAKRFIEDLL